MNDCRFIGVKFWYERPYGWQALFFLNQPEGSIVCNEEFAAYRVFRNPNGVRAEKLIHGELWMLYDNGAINVDSPPVLKDIHDAITIYNKFIESNKELLRKPLT